MIKGTPGSDVIYGTAGDDYVISLEGDDTVYGFSGDDYLFGGAGADKLYGGSGDDYLEGGAGGDALDGGTGSDTASYLNSSVGVHINLGTGSAWGGDATGDVLTSIENLFGSSQDDFLYGNNVDNELLGASGNDLIYGYGGNDTLDGGAGNDHLVGGAGADILNGGDGWDLADYLASASAVMVDLTNHTAHGGDAEGDELSSIEKVDGSMFNDVLVGDEGINSFRGNSGDDVLYGRGGGDTLNGGYGDDFLQGGAGKDWLTGGKGADDFVFARASESGVSAYLRDVIQDFSQADGDRIDLSMINAKSRFLVGDTSFTFINNQLFSAEGQIRVAQENGNTIIQGNTTGTSGAEFEIELTGQHNLSASDFVL
jgi:Ca2+-binding RTX toxin-like protein